MAEKKNTGELVRLVTGALDDKKAENIQLIDISQVSTLGDYFVIASGANANQVQAMADAVEEKLGRAGVPPRSVEGYDGAKWILMDYGDIIVHVFDRDTRSFYDIERIWRDGRSLNLKDIQAKNSL